MTLENIYYVGQTIAVVAIIGSLIVLIIQNRQAHQLAVDTAVRHQIEGMQNISRSLFETPGLADIWRRGNMGLGHLVNDERVRYLSFLNYTLRIWEASHTVFIKGDVAEALWISHTRQLRDVQAMEGVRQAWEMRRHVFSDAFQSFYDENASKGVPKDDMYGLRLETHAASAAGQSR